MRKRAAFYVSDTGDPLILTGLQLFLEGAIFTPIFKILVRALNGHPNSGGVNMHLVCAYAKSRFSNGVAHILSCYHILVKSASEKKFGWQLTGQYEY